MQGDFVKRIIDFFQILSAYLFCIYVKRARTERLAERIKKYYYFDESRCITKRNKNGAHASGYEGILL